MKDYLNEAHLAEKRFVEKTNIEKLLTGIKGEIKFIDPGFIPPPELKYPSKKQHYGKARA